MGCPIPACATSFFKIMIGDNFSKVLFLPPKFARTVSDLIDQKTQLEDASGQRWTVTLSKYDGSLAFQQGWPAFSLEHGLEIGDFVLFHYIEQSLFVVQIYGKNGCEKLYFSKENSNQKKRTRADRDSSAKDEQCHTIDNVSINSMNKEGANTSAVSDVPRTKCIEEPFYMIDRDSGVGQVDRLSALYDLADFEMQRTSSVDGTKDVRPLSHVNTMPQSQAEVEIVDKLPVTEEVTYGNGNTSGRERRSKTRYSSNKDLISQKDTSLMERCQSMQQKFAGVSKFCEFPASVQTWNCQSGERMKGVKKERVEMRAKKMMHGKYPEIKECDRSSNPSMKDNDHVYKVVKTEPVDATSTLSVKIPFLAVTGRLSFLELPSCLPSVSFRGRPIMERKVLVRLRDPLSRLWPVIYHEKQGIKVLASGWEAFCKANRIQVGDECFFEIEDVSECIYEVSVDRK
ncbi:B3 domain-containing protein Os01g0905400 [Camellia lanceoleosa]|uniref:B3 domain-containing protein Os01g0905400 n=1 Tax=Camellia lanceoleosa TaxID=1840588 RepID=A0ACC0HYV0_9ERIC|nr:B3 domain-containing protein Os01g0905400 [Camellia lanceoleosa]